MTTWVKDGNVWKQSDNPHINIDATPVNGSGNPVSSNGVYDALAGKASTSSVTNKLPKPVRHMVIGGNSSTGTTHGTWYLNGNYWTFITMTYGKQNLVLYTNTTKTTADASVICAHYDSSNGNGEASVMGWIPPGWWWCFREDHYNGDRHRTVIEFK